MGPTGLGDVHIHVAGAGHGIKIFSMTQKYLTSTVPVSAQCEGCDNPHIHKQVGYPDSESFIKQPGLVFSYMTTVSSME